MGTHTHSGHTLSLIRTPSFRLFSHLWLELLALLHQYFALPVSVGTAMECVELGTAPPNGPSVFCDHDF